MRESEEYLESNVWFAEDLPNNTASVVYLGDAQDAVKLAFKEGRESMYKDVIAKLKELEEANWYNSYKNIIENLEELGKD